MDTRQLRSFLKIADLRSISRAAESLGLSQPSLSQQLLRLEDEVGVKLFRRTARGVTVTEAGRIFQEHARQILRSADQALTEVRQFNAEPSGEVVFAVPHTVSKLIGVELVEAVIERAPHLSLRLVEAFSGNIRGWLEAGKIDLGLLHDRGSMRNLAARKVVSEEMFLIGPPGRFGTGLTDLPAVQPEDLDTFPLIAPGRQHGMRGFLDKEASRMGFSYRLTHQIDAVGNIAALVGRGHGFAVLPLPAVSDDLAAGKVSVARIGDGSLRRTLCMVRNPAQVVSHASVLVEDLTVRIMARLVESGAWAAEMHVDAD